MKARLMGGLMIRDENPRALLDFSGSKGLLVGGAIPANSR